MIKLTEILSKPIISINNCKNEGTVSSAVFDKNFKRLKSLILFDNEEQMDSRYLNINSIYSYGENAIIIKDDNDLSVFPISGQVEDKSSIINCNCYTYLGKFLGKVTEIVMNDRFYIEKILVGNTEIDILDIIKTGVDTIIVQDNDKRVKVNSLKNKRKRVVKIENLKIDNSQKVYILNPESNEDSIESMADENLPTENALETKSKYNLDNNPYKPQFLTTNYDMLIGRKLTQNIYSSSFELIARKNTKITQEILEKARILNKTREIIKYSH